MASKNISSSWHNSFKTFSPRIGPGNSTTIISNMTIEELETQTDLLNIHWQNGTAKAGFESTSVKEIPEEISWEWYELEWEWEIIIQLIAAIVGIFGNLLVMMVVFRRGVRRRSTDILIGALALADFLTSVFLIPIPQIKQLPPTGFGQLYCKIVFINMFMWTSVTVSVHILSVVSVERLVAIAYPLHFKNLFPNRLTVLYISIVIAVDVAVHVVFSFVAFVDEKTGNCIIQYPSLTLQVDVGIVLFFYKFAVPLFVMLGAQSLTAVALHAEYRRFNMFNETSKSVNACSPQFKLLTAKKRVINMLLIVVLTFFICWGPSQILYLLLNVDVVPFSLFYSPLMRFLVVLAFFNSCLNPVIYTARYPRFREALTDLLLGSLSSKSQTPIFGPKEETPKILSNDTSELPQLALE